jgi:hypothetical protein
MGRRRTRPVRITELGKAIWSIRRRRTLGQVAFARLIGAGIDNSNISRYEGGLNKPELKGLLSLLCMAEAPAERRPILRELKRQGIDQVIHCLVVSGLFNERWATPPVSDERTQTATAKVQIFPEIASRIPAPAPSEQPVLAGDPSEEENGTPRA